MDSDLRIRSQVTVFYDSLIAKLICWAEDRATAVERMLRALREFKIVGVQTTIPFQIQLFQNRKFRAGRIHTSFVDQEFDFSGCPLLGVEQVGDVLRL